MESTSIIVAGVTLCAPVNAATNILLTLQCLACWAWLGRRQGERARCWSLFFQMMAVATAAGVVKHAFQESFDADGFTLVLATSSVASGFSILFAQQATLASRAASREWLRPLPWLQLGAFLLANVLWGPEIVLLIANTAIGLIPVIIAEAGAARRGADGGAPVAGGLALSILSGLVYLGGISPSPWFNHIDVAHLVMGASFELLRRGARVPGRAAVGVSHGKAPLFPAAAPAAREVPWRS